MDIFFEIRKLNFPPDKYVVFGGAALAARGIRETHDIDILISPDLFENCRKSGQWNNHPRLNPNDPAALDNGVVEIYPTIGGGFDASFEELRKNAEIIDGIPFCGLQDITRIKQAFGREKDLRDIDLIKEFLNSKR